MDNGFMWVVSATVKEKLQVVCLTENHEVDIHPQVEIIRIGNTVHIVYRADL